MSVSVTGDHVALTIFISAPTQEARRTARVLVGASVLYPEVGRRFLPSGFDSPALRLARHPARGFEQQHTRPFVDVTDDAMSRVYSPTRDMARLRHAPISLGVKKRAVSILYPTASESGSQKLFPSSPVSLRVECGHERTASPIEAALPDRGHARCASGRCDGSFAVTQSRRVDTVAARYDYRSESERLGSRSV